jgi:hypothetical protein
MIEDAKLIHAALVALEKHLEASKQTVPITKARVLASRLHRLLDEGVTKHAAQLPPDVVAFSGSVKPPRD